MIRSMIANIDPTTKEVNIRRNLELENLQKVLNSESEGEPAGAPVGEESCKPECKLWLDIVDPTDDEIDWVAHQFKLNPAVVKDLLTTDRRPALMVYPTYLFLSLFQPHIHLSEIKGIEIHCIITDNCFITVRESEASTVDAAYNRVAQNPA
ncbi:MAG TPA: CorA family divalent cation transporter, partial [Phototrophicaceae bacterium]|nr:CorA family divalent cation transporter [Phototrophicaceae bacterium]